MRLPLRLAAVTASALGGAAVGVCSVAVHSWLWGLPLALAAVAATIAVLPPGVGRLPFALGWTVVVGVLATGRPEGDVLVSQDAAGVVLVLAAPVVVVGGFVGMLRRRAAPPDADAGLASSDT